MPDQISINGEVFTRASVPDMLYLLDEAGQKQGWYLVTKYRKEDKTFTTTVYVGDGNFEREY